MKSEHLFLHAKPFLELVMIAGVAIGAAATNGYFESQYSCADASSALTKLALGLSLTLLTSGALCFVWIKRHAKAASPSAYARNLPA